MAVAGSLAGCGGRDTEVTPMLDRAEAVMDAHPDSALVLLDSLDGSATLHGLMNEADRARYALLLTQARHKNYIDETSDSLITTAVDYYDRHSSAEPFRLMLSRYYQGVVRSNSRNYASAIISLMKAEALAEHLDQPLWLGRSLLAIRDIYHEIYSFSEEERYARLAYDAFNASTDTLSQKFAKEVLVVALSNARHFEQSNILAEEMLDDAIHDCDTQFICKSLEHIGFNHQHLSHHKDAADAFMRIKALGEQYMTTDLYYYLTTALWNSGDHETAAYLIDSLKHASDKSSELHPEILYEIGLTKEAYDQQNRKISEFNDIFKEIINQNVSSTVSKYYQDEITVHQARSQRNRAIIICIAIVSILIFLFLSYKISVSKRDKVRKEQEIMNLAKELGSLNLELDFTAKELASVQDELNSTSSQLDRLSSESCRQLYCKNRLESDRLNALSILCEYYSSTNLKESTKTQTAEKVLAFINRVASDPNLNSDLEAKVDRDYDNLMQRFRQQMPNLNEKDYRIFVWGVLRISTSTIHYLWKMNCNTFYSLRRRLREKIIDSNLADASKFLKYLN